MVYDEFRSVCAWKHDVYSKNHMRVDLLLNWTSREIKYTENVNIAQWEETAVATKKAYRNL